MGTWQGDLWFVRKTSQLEETTIQTIGGDSNPTSWRRQHKRTKRKASQLEKTKQQTLEISSPGKAAASGNQQPVQISSTTNQPAGGDNKPTSWRRQHKETKQKASQLKASLRIFGRALPTFSYKNGNLRQNSLARARGKCPTVTDSYVKHQVGLGSRKIESQVEPAFHPQLIFEELG